MALHRRIVSDYRSGELECGDACFPPPPPPPPLDAGVTTRPPIPSPPLTPIQINNKNHALPLVVVVIASVLAVCLFFLAYYAVHRYRSSRRRRSAGLAAAWGPPQPPADAEGHLLRGDLLVVGGGGGGGGEEPYHVWYIRTAGLEEAVIGAITVCEYKKGEGLVEGTDCAVCLGEFGEGEPLRLLPKCSHAFHVPCIDTWLRSHVNCPLCRAPILAPPPPLPRPPPSLPSPAVGGISSGPEVVVHGSALQATTAGEDSGGAENSLLRRIASVDGSDEGGNSAILLPAQVGVDHPPAGASSFSSEESEIWVPIDLGNGGFGDEIASYAPPGDGDAGGGELQPVRRSVSMDSSALAGLLLRMRLGGSSRDGGRKPSVGEDTSTNKKWGTGGNNRKGASLLDAQLEMERSMSGGRFLLSRFSGRVCSATLPL